MMNETKGNSELGGQTYRMRNGKFYRVTWRVSPITGKKINVTWTEVQ